MMEEESDLQAAAKRWLRHMRTMLNGEAYRTSPYWEGGKIDMAFMSEDKTMLANYAAPLLIVKLPSTNAEGE
jgi:hypothetical protein